MSSTFYIETFGCQMNVHDSEKVRGLLEARGYRQVPTPAEASMVLYNTCSIRDKAEQKMFSRLANLKRVGSAKTIGVLGCAAQHNGEAIFDLAPHVDFVCGSASYNSLPALLDRVEAGEPRVAGLALDANDTFDTPRTERDRPYSAYITIIEGCDKACTYCVVPFTRGPERSRPSAAVMEEARGLAASGYTEVALLGQTVNSYRDPSPAGWSFARLLDEIGRLPHIRRVRFTTSHPNDFTPDIVEALDRNEALCDWVHLPVQSGSSRVLQGMRRTYSRRRVPALRRDDQGSPADHRAQYRHHRRLPGRNRGGLRADALLAGGRSSTPQCFRSSTRRARALRRLGCRRFRNPRKALG